jgi:folate-dependent phosphoribosylglycinamide formyltransferase PurN
MRAIVLTSTMRRHQHVANTAASRIDVVHVWQEEKSFQPMKYAASPEDEAVIARHFDARDASEEAYFAGDSVATAPSTRVPAGGCNAPEQVAAMRALAPDVVLVFGTSLLKQPVIDAFPDRIINIHLGLSPYYRGAGTNFWPLVNGEPEYCGATIHFLDAGVDSGPIIAQQTVPVLDNDTAETVHHRIQLAEHELYPKCVATIARGEVSVQGRRVLWKSAPNL